MPAPELSKGFDHTISVNPHNVLALLSTALASGLQGEPDK